MATREEILALIGRKSTTGFSRSSGAGGQNVNKVNTKALVSIAIADLDVLSAEERDRVAAKLKARLTRTGELQVQVQDERTQGRNRALAVERLADLVLAALRVPRKRKKTKVPRAARAERLTLKKRQTRKKIMRRRASEHE